MLRAFVLSALVAAGLPCLAAEPRVLEHNVVFYEKDRFAGWPANNGCWSWGDEIVCGFSLGYYKERGGGHPIDRDRPSGPMQARSLDGGRTWTIETPSYVGDDGKEREPQECPGGIEFTHPDFAARFRGSSFCYSQDRCRTWSGPFQLPLFGRERLLARTDYIVRGEHDLIAFIASVKDDGKEGWPFSIRTRDGGKTWERGGWIGPQPESGGYAIMPSTLQLSDQSFLSMIRRNSHDESGERWWIDAWLSPDDGESWYRLAEPVIENHGNPPHMIRLEDGRIALTYGDRNESASIRARISEDRGQTWGSEFVVRDGAGSWDIGYPRTVQRADGRLVTMYYFWDPETGKERYIAATIWDAGEPVETAQVP